MIKIDEIFKQLDLYDNLKKQVEIQADKIKHEMETIDWADMEQLDYATISKLSEKLRYKVSQDISCKLDMLYHKKREELYPEAYGVHYFPEIKEIDFLTEEEKILLDTKLAQLSINDYTYIIRNTFRKAYKVKQIHDFLYSKGIVQKMYRITCDCGESTEWMSEESYNHFMINFALKHNQREPEYAYYTFYCDECDSEMELSTVEELQKFSEAYDYKMNKTPDYKWDTV